MTGQHRLTFAVERVPPRLAREYLALNSHNRKISPVTVTRYAQAIRRGEWRMTGEAMRAVSCETHTASAAR